MNILKSLFGVATSVVKPVASAVADVKVKKEETKQLEIGLKGKLNLTAAEWDLISKKNEASTWKDEFVTVVIYLPLIALMMAGLWQGMSDPEHTLWDSALVVMDEISKIDTTGGYGQLLFWVTIAALGLKAIMGKK